MTTEYPEQAPTSGPAEEISDDQLVAMLVDRARGTDLKLPQIVASSSAG